MPKNAAIAVSDSSFGIFKRAPPAATGALTLEFKDYYQALGVEKSAPADEIKKAYRKLARKYHPDVSKEPDAEKRMQEVNEAYAVLSDTEKRAASDPPGRRPRAGPAPQPPPDWDAGFEFSGADAGDMSDFFANLFGRASRARNARGAHMRGEDHHAKIVIDLADSYHGTTRAITMRSPATDESGHVVLKERMLNVTIPKGVREGQHIRLAGQGSPGFGEGPPGDLYLVLQIALPPAATDKARELYETMAREMAFNPRQKMGA